MGAINVDFVVTADRLPGGEMARFFVILGSWKLIASMALWRSNATAVGVA